MPATPEFNNYTNFMPERLFIKNILKIKFVQNRLMMVSI
jgi:hypothetical protein